ncbi:MAG: hypothetical protein CL677_05390 [Bdellovibrionaceae bacterium]|nr:hypothetical protein [Pseudobdellovibrionaceae bacterium]
MRVLLGAIPNVIDFFWQRERGGSHHRLKYKIGGYMKKLITTLAALMIAVPALALDPTGHWRFSSDTCSGGATPTESFNPGTTFRMNIAGRSDANHGTMTVFGIWYDATENCQFNDSGMWSLASNGTTLTFLSNGTSDSCSEERFINPPFVFELASVTSTVLTMDLGESSVCPTGQTYRRLFNKVDLTQ